jgi:hypothetical protein
LCHVAFQISTSKPELAEHDLPKIGAVGAGGAQR